MNILDLNVVCETHEYIRDTLMLLLLPSDSQEIIFISMPWFDDVFCKYAEF